MIKLDEAAKIGERTYDGLVAGRGNWDLFLRRVEIVMIPAEECPDYIRIGKVDRTNGRPRLRAPIPMLKVNLQDTETQPDPAFGAALDALTEALGQVESLIADRLSGAVFEWGEADFLLDGTFQPNGDKPIKCEDVPQEGNEPNALPSPPDSPLLPAPTPPRTGP